MRIVVSGRNIQLTKALKDHVVEKARKLEHHYDFVVDMHFYLSVEKKKSIANNQSAEVTIHVSGAVVRVSYSSGDMYTSIDKLIDKMDRSLSRHKTKLLHRTLHGKHETESNIRQTHIVEDAHTHDPNEVDVDELYWVYQEEDDSLMDAPAAASAV
jgi:putative sigma-54 modulation protein